MKLSPSTTTKTIPLLLSSPLLKNHSNVILSPPHPSFLPHKQCNTLFSRNFSILLHSPFRNVFEPNQTKLFDKHTPFSKRRALLPLIISRGVHGMIKRSGGQQRRQAAFLDSLETVVDPYVPEPFPSLINPLNFTRAVLRSWLNMYKNVVSNVIIRFTMRKFAKKEKNPELKVRYEGFSVTKFANFTKNAYIRINESMAKGDTGTLKDLVTPKMLTKLSMEMSLLKKGHTCAWKLVEFKKVKPVTVRMVKIGEGNIKADFSQITVEISALQSIQVKNERGVTVTSSGDVLVEEYWTFERQIQHPASFWRLLERRVKVNPNQKQIENKQ